MKLTIRTLFLIVATAVAAGMTLWAADSDATAKHATPPCEHRVLEREGNLVSSDRDLAGKINRLGRDGWEMYAVTPIQQEGTTKRLQFYFKRPAS